MHGDLAGMGGKRKFVQDIKTTQNNILEKLLKYHIYNAKYILIRNQALDGSFCPHLPSLEPL